jgi:hypothetical protein
MRHIFDLLKFRTLDFWKNAMAPVIFDTRAGRVIKMRCERSMKNFSQRAQRLCSERKVCGDKCRQTKPKHFFSSINGITMVPVFNSRVNRC